MNKTVQLALAMTFMATLTLGLHSNAQADGLYIGGGVYSAQIDSAAIDESDTVPAFFIGYYLIDRNLIMLSVEAGYYDLGEASSGGLHAEASALTLAGVATLPITSLFELYAKLGVAQVDITTSGTDFNSDDDSTESFGGVGFGIDFFDTIDIYAEYLAFDTELNSEIFGVGVRLAF